MYQSYIGVHGDGYLVQAKYKNKEILNHIFSSKDQANREFLNSKFYFLRTALDKTCIVLAYRKTPLLPPKAAAELKQWHDLIYKGAWDMDFFCSQLISATAFNIQRMLRSHSEFTTVKKQWLKLEKLAEEILNDLKAYNQSKNQ